MRKVRNLIVFISIAFFSCSNLEDNIKEYRNIKNEIEEITKKVTDGVLEEELGIQRILKLEEKLRLFDDNVVTQYNKEEKIKNDLEILRKKEAIENKIKLHKERNDSIKQARVRKKELAKLKKKEAKQAREAERKRKLEVAQMIEEEAAAERNAYIKELKEKGFFLASFNGKSYKINVKEWEAWKASENYNFEEEKTKIKEVMRAMGMAKAQELIGAMHRTLSGGIAREGITMKAVQGIQMFDVMTTGEEKFY